MKIELQSYRFLDVHYHASPDLYERRYSVLDIGKVYQALGGAVVLKSHLGSTAVQATIAQQEGLPVFPSLVMNSIAGGLNYQSILRALAEYQPLIQSKLIVHLPTITGRQHTSKLSRAVAHPAWHHSLSQSETVSDVNGKLKPEMVDIFKVACDYPIVLSTGHAAKNEVYALIEGCIRHNVSALMLNQPANPLTGLNAKELYAITSNSFVWCEQTALTYLLAYQSEEDFSEVLQHVPRTIYSSDLGQASQIDIPAWRELSEQWFTKFNLSSERRSQLCLQNPLNLLQI